MIKHNITTTIKAIMGDRPYFFLMSAVMLAAILYALFVILSVESRDIQVVTHYTGFGESFYYRTPWYYLYSFAALGILIGVMHSVIMAKLYNYQRRVLGILLGWQTLLLLFIALIYTINVLQVAYL